MPNYMIPFVPIIHEDEGLFRPVIEKHRQGQKDPTLLEDFEQLDALMADLDRQHGVGDEYITKQQLRRFVEVESKALATEEAPHRRSKSLRRSAPRACRTSEKASSPTFVNKGKKMKGRGSAQAQCLAENGWIGL
jgi:hypothetical protein